MPVYQVEEYYISITRLDLTVGQKSSIEEMLSDEGYSNYEFQDNNTALMVDDIPSESDGDALEDQLNEIINCLTG